MQLVVQDPVEGNFHDGRAHGKFAIEDERRGFVGLVEVVLLRAVTRAVGAYRGGTEFEFHGVQGQLTNGFLDRDVNFNASREGKRLEIGGEKDPIGRGDDASGETVGVGR